MPKKPKRQLPTFRSVAIETSIVVGAIVTAVLGAKEFWKPADWFVSWVKAEDYRAPLLVLIVAIVVLLKNAIVAAQIQATESSRFNPIGNRQQRRAATSIHRKQTRN
jgi:hypothetical protein